MFDTIVVRKPNYVGGYMTIRELQLWINDINRLPLDITLTSNNVNGEDLGDTPEFIDWDTKKTKTAKASDRIASQSFDNDFNTSCNTPDNNTTISYALYIPSSETYNINDIQSIVLYSLLNDSEFGYSIELYNRSNDPNLTQILASTNEITTTSSTDVYRYDYPAIDTYTGGFSDTDSISQIASENLALKEVSEIAESVNFVGGLKVDTITTTGNIIMEGGILQVNRIKGNNNVGNISIVFNNGDNLHFFNTTTNSSVGYIQHDTNTNQIDFTGQHRCFIKDLPFSNTDVYEGRIVCADQNTNITISGSIKKGNQAITQNETLPYVSLSVKNNDKSCFGVISASEDPNERVVRYGAFCTPFEKEKGDTRVYINSLGEGAIWVSNKNGELESGDYITTCDLLGYGAKQDDDVLHNYTVAKITMDCDFNPRYVPRPTIMKDASGENILDPYEQIQWTDEEDASGNVVYEYEYNILYVNNESQIIPYEEYIDNSNNAYIVAYVGCTYHCG